MWLLGSEYCSNLAALTNALAWPKVGPLMMLRGLALLFLGSTAVLYLCVSSAPPLTAPDAPDQLLQWHFPSNFEQAKQLAVWLSLYRSLFFCNNH